MLHPLWGGRKIAQIGQTELIMHIHRHYQVTRRRMCIRREAKFVQNTRLFIAEIRQMTNFCLNFCFILTLQPRLKGFVKLFLCLVWCAHFAIPPFFCFLICELLTLNKKRYIITECIRRSDIGGKIGR